MTVEKEKSLCEKKNTIREYRLVFFEAGKPKQSAESILARLSLPREWPLSPCQNGAAIRTATSIGHLLEEVRILTKQMCQPNQSNGRAEVSRVFGRSQDGQRNPSSSINQNLPHYNISVSSQ